MQKFMDTEYDKTFESTAECQNLTAANLSKIPFMEMLEILRPLVLVEVPETFNFQEDKKRLDYLLARLTNTHAYLQYMWAAASYERARLKKIDADKAEDMAKKKEALYALASSVKLKYEAVSRKITVELEGEGDPKMSERRSYSNKSGPPSSNRSGPPFINTSEPKKGGGWGNVG